MFYRFFYQVLETTALVQVVTLQMRRLRPRKDENLAIFIRHVCPSARGSLCGKWRTGEHPQGEWEGQGQLLFGNQLLNVPPIVLGGPSWASGMQREYTVSWTFSISPRIYLPAFWLGLGLANERHQLEITGQKESEAGGPSPLLGRSLLWLHPSRKGTRTAFSTHLAPDSRNCSLPSPVLDPSPLAGPALSFLNFLCK